MIFVPLKYLRADMVVARDITCSSSYVPLFAAGQRLTETNIEKFKRNNVQGAYIESKLCDDVEAEEFLNPEFKQETLKEIKNIYSHFTSSKGLSSGVINSLTSVADDIINYIISKDECLFNVIDIKDYDAYTYTHSMYVSILSTMIGIKLGYSRTMLGELAMSGLLHDTGKLELPISIINKTTPLTDIEFDLIKTHPTRAVLRLKPYHQISMPVLVGIGNHHEKFDGTGYPRGLVGEDIPVFGRILALADVYDALTSERPYREACSSSEALEYMMGCADTHFDYELLKIFFNTVIAYPAGTIVNLSNGYIGVVVGNTPSNVLRPKLRMIEPPEHMGEEIDLASDMKYLSVTIIGIGGDGELPKGIFQ